MNSHPNYGKRYGPEYHDAQAWKRQARAVAALPQPPGVLFVPTTEAAALVTAAVMGWELAPPFDTVAGRELGPPDYTAPDGYHELATYVTKTGFATIWRHHDARPVVILATVRRG